MKFNRGFSVEHSTKQVRSNKISFGPREAQGEFEEVERRGCNGRNSTKAKYEKT
jgi:hypothetical protein